MFNHSQCGGDMKNIMFGDRSCLQVISEEKGIAKQVAVVFDMHI